MTTDTRTSETTLAPDDAFAVLGNETRMEILQTLGEADEPLSFSELRGRVGMRDSGQFNYHLGKLEGHFIKDTDGGYALGQKGRRVIEAVLSGAVTDTPVLERTPVDMACNRCGATPIEVDYQDERLGVYCSECAGMYDPDERDHPPERERLGFHGAVPMPPAGLQNRTPEELMLATITWWGGETIPTVSGVCSRCSAPVTHSVTVCENHDASDGLCDRCGRRYAAYGQNRCTNCPYERSGILGIYLVANADLRAFLLEHGIDIFSPSSERVIHILLEYDEEILTTNPFKGRFTFTIDEDTLTLTVDDNLSVIEANEGTAEGAV